MASLGAGIICVVLCLNYGPDVLRNLLDYNTFENFGQEVLYVSTTAVALAAMMLVQICAWLVEWRLEEKRLAASLQDEPESIPDNATIQSKSALVASAKSN